MSILFSCILLFGAFFALIAAIGLLRLPDTYMRMHAATKAGAFGGAIIVLVCALLAGDLFVWVKAILIILFFYTTAPIAAHMVGRAAYVNKTKLWQGTKIDRLKGHYDKKD
ncbi:MAG: monovalent cation/H(+) antiporter subunit G [Verrucomicrobiota bacterium]